jgi:hypothetical protein
MKRVALMVTLAVISAGLLAGCAGKDDTANLPVLSVNDIQSDPLAFVGRIKINGVASAFSEDDAAFFAVMDFAELMVCKNLYCEAYALPAKYTGSGPLPELADVVDIVGSFVQTDTGYYFEAVNIEVQRNIMSLLVFSNPGGAG